MRGQRDRGSALAAALVLTILVAGLVAALVTYSFPYIRTTASFNERVVAVYAAEGGLEEVRTQIAASDYDSNGNLWLMENSEPEAAGGMLVYGSGGKNPSLTLGGAAVSVRITDVGAMPYQFYRVEATALYAGQKVALAWELRARDTFAKYMFFNKLGDFNVGNPKVRGSVYVGRTLNNYNGGAQYYKSVEAREGIKYFDGATQDNTSYFDVVDPSAPETKMPSTNEIATLHENTTAPQYDVQNSSSYYSGGGDMNTYVTLQGDQVEIVAKNKQTGSVVKSFTGPLPPNGLIFSQGDVYLKGDLSGRLTLATMGKVSVLDKVRYKDQDGDLAYTLKKDGAVVPNNEDGTQNAWTEANGYEYSKNSDYNPDPENAPVLGILAKDKIEIVADAPYNMELHAANFSAEQRWFCDLSKKKGNLRMLGSVVGKYAGWRYNKFGWGYAKSGEYIYDTTLLNNPPPYYLKVDKPVWGPRWEL